VLLLNATLGSVGGPNQPMPAEIVWRVINYCRCQ